MLSVVQWIERGPPKAEMQVRFLPGRPDGIHLKEGVQSRTDFLEASPTQKTQSAVHSMSQDNRLAVLQAQAQAQAQVQTQNTAHVINPWFN